jgi:predicted PurR-regulated permease PerM
MPASEEPGSAATAVHPLVRVAAAWTWRALVLLAGVAALAMLAGKFKDVLVPAALALLATALLNPIVGQLSAKMRRSFAVLATMLAGAVVVAAVGIFVSESFISGFAQLADRASQTLDQTRQWAETGPLHVTSTQIHNTLISVEQELQANKEKIASGALSTTSVAAKVVSGAFLTLFTCIFMLYDGAGVWEFCTRLVPRTQRERVRGAGRAGFASLTGYVRGTIIVAAADAVMIAIALLLLRVPMAVPLAALVFAAAFIPIIGAFVAGTAAVAVALITNGMLSAVIVLCVIVAVMQVEAHVLQPLVLGKAVSLHPLAVVLGISAGAVVGGIVGALLAVPAISFCNTAVRALLAPASEPDAGSDTRSAKHGN